jgi:cell division protein DivIC
MKKTTFKHIKKIFLKNKFLTITVFLFLLWVIFIDDNSILQILQYKKRINDLKEEKRFYIEKFIEDSTRLQQIKSPEMIEKFARERYFMKADNEDVFVIINENDK